MWNMVTDPLHHRVFSALLASLPIVYLFYALAYRRMKGHWAAISTVVLALSLAIFAYGMPVRVALMATVNGMLFGLWPVAWIVVTAVFLYNLSVETGEFEIIKNSLASITDDRRIQALFIAFSFGAFIEGAAGFGTPVAITAAMLAGLGFNPLYAAGLCLVANTAPVAYGAIGIPIIVASQVSGIDQMAISQMVGRTLPFLSVVIPMYLVVLLSGWKKGWEVWPAALVSGLSFALAQWATSQYLGPMLPDILASLASILALAIFLRFWRPRESWHFAGEAASQGKAELRFGGGAIFRAWTPFLLLSLLVAAWGLQPIRQTLDHYTLCQFAVPGLDQQILRDGKPLAAVFKWNILSAAGTAILLAALASTLVMGASLSQIVRVFGKTLKTLRWPVVTISFILGFAYIMNLSGMAATLGNGFAATGPAFVFLSAFLGWLGVFMTGSDTSSNALFGKLQEVTATQIGVDPVVTVAANSSGGVCGKMISPQSLSVATAATGLVGKEADLFRFTLKHSLILTTFIAILVTLQAYVFTWLIPVYVKGSTSAAATAPLAKNISPAGLVYLAIVLALVVALVFMAKKRNRHYWK
jgi:lactate permease